jgi:hypothetical protein
MNDKPNKAIGLFETDPSTPAAGTDEVDRDTLLMRLEIRLERYRDNSKLSMIKIILPLAIAFPLSGCLIYYTLIHIEGHKPLWLIFSGLGFFVIGIFLVILLVILVVLGTLRARLIEKADYDFLEKFHCDHFTSKDESSDKIPFCRYFNHDLENEPLCLICPIYKATAAKVEN